MTATRTRPTLQDSAEAWARARGHAVPRRGTPAWAGMFSAWQRAGMAPNPEVLVRHLYAAECLAGVLRSWGWHARVIRRPGGWLVDTNAHPSHVTEAVKRCQAALEELPPTQKRTPNRAVSDRFSELGDAREAAFGAQVSERTKPVLAALSQAFSGGGAFTREQAAAEIAGVLRGARGQRVSPGTAAVRVGHALAELEKAGYVERAGKDLNAQGRPGPQKFTLTVTGEQRAEAQSDIDAFDFGANVVEKQIAQLEAQGGFAPPSAPVLAHGPSPLSGAVYRPSLPVLATPGHKLPALQKARIRKAGYRVNPGAEGRVFKVGKKWGVRGFGTLSTFPVLFATKREALAKAEANERFAKEFNGTTDADELAVLQSLAPAAPPTVKLSKVLRDSEKTPPGGWTDADRVSNPLTKAESRRFLKEAASLRHVAGQRLVDARRHKSPISLAAASRSFGEAEGLASVVRHAGPKNRSMEGPALWALKKANTGDYVALHVAQALELESRRRATNGPRSKLCAQGRHDFEPATGLCRRKGCPAFHHAGQEVLFGRDLDPEAVREARERERLTGQRDLFGRADNPLSVLVLGNSPGGSPQAGPRAPLAANPQPGRARRAQNPPAGTIGVEEVRRHCQMFHGAPVARWLRVRVDDGKPGVTNKAVTALGLTEATVYSAPWKKSNKHAAGVYEHLHEDKKPLEVYDPVAHVSVKLLEHGSGPSDWWRDDRDPQRALNAGARKSRRSA